MQLSDIREKARYASVVFPAVKDAAKKPALLAIAKSLDDAVPKIIEASKRDAKKKLGKEINEAYFLEIIKGIRELASIPDPVNQILKSTELSEGMELYCVSSPLGIIAALIEDDPLAVISTACLALKSGNVLYICAKESECNKAIIDIIKKQSAGYDIPEFLFFITQKEQKKLLDEPLSLLIPIGTKFFMDGIKKSTSLPILGSAEGMCSIYVDESADIEQAVNVCYDAKCQQPDAINAMETLLVHKEIAKDFLWKLKEVLDVANARYLGDDEALKVLSIEHMKDKDWGKEFKNLTLAIKVVKDIDEAIDFINQHGSHHTDAIICKTKPRARKFLEKVDSANVFWNCSTRFSNAYRYGLGLELTTSLSKLHARGQVSLEGLVIYKWKVLGSGDILADYLSDKRSFTHKEISKPFPLDKEI